MKDSSADSKPASAMREGFVKVNGVPTHVATWGPWIEDGLGPGKKKLVLLVTGNPGLAGYYTKFLSELHVRLGGTPIWAVSMAGHLLPPKNTTGLPPLEENPHLYNLQGQILHKMEFVSNFVPEDTEIILIGHSIGAHIILEMLKKGLGENKKVKKAYLLFPTIERMAESPNGKLMTGFVKPIVSIVIFLSWIFTLLPLPIQKLLLAVHFILRGITTDHVGTTLRLVNPTVLSNVFFLAYDELDVVTVRDDEALEKLRDVLFLYYGTTDRWVPLTYWKDVVRTHPKLKCFACDKKIDHAFVLRFSEQMADLMAEWVQKDFLEE